MYCKNIIDACLKAADQTIPKTKKTRLVGWNERVRPLKDDAIFWHKLWIDNGRPTAGIIFDIRKSTRYKYKKAIKSLKHEQANLKSQKMAESFMSNNKRNIWAETRKVFGKTNNVPGMIDGFQSDQDICDTFAKRYDELYNCVGYDENEMCKLKTNLMVEAKEICKG